MNVVRKRARNVIRLNGGPPQNLPLQRHWNGQNVIPIIALFFNKTRRLFWMRSILEGWRTQTMSGRVRSESPDLLP